MMTEVDLSVSACMSGVGRVSKVLDQYQTKSYCFQITYSYILRHLHYAVSFEIPRLCYANTVASDSP